MKSILNYYNKFSIGIQFLLLLAALAFTYSDSHLHRYLYMILILVLIILEMVKLKYNGRRRQYIWIMTLFSMLLCLFVMLIYGNTMLQIYYFFLLDFIYNEEVSRRKHVLICLHFTCFMGTEAVLIFAKQHRDLNQGSLDLFIMLVSYSFILFIFATVHYYKSEQKRLQILNANILAYSFEEREYLIEKERSEISQELHDDIGHSLMAALLNVRYLKAISQKSQDEKDKQIKEIEELLKQCVVSLRNSVSCLRELEENINLKEETLRIVKKLNTMGFVHIDLKYDDAVSNSSNRIRSAIYRTIKEGITNSIQHGNAAKIYISIMKKDQIIYIIIRDNGSGCTGIKKSYGLHGIEERIKELHGEIEFAGIKNKGFTISAKLPEGIKE